MTEVTSLLRMIMNCPMPYELSDALRIYEDEDTSDQAKSGCYDLCSDDMWSVTVYIIRTDL